MTRTTALTWIRALAAALLIIVFAVALTASVTAYWMGTVLLDNDTFTTAIEPLITDSSMLDRTSDRVSESLLSRLDLRALAGSNVPDAFRPLVENLSGEFERLVRSQISGTVNSDGFALLARSRLQAWHLAFARSITDPTIPAEEGAALRVTLGPYIDLLTEKTDQPFVRWVLERLPDTVRDARVAVLDAAPFADRLPALRALSRARPFLPWLAAVALIAGLLLAPRRAWAIVGAGVALAASGAAMRFLIDSESQRAIGLVSRWMGASSAASNEAISTLTSPLSEWSGWIIGAGAALALTEAVLAIARRRSAATPDPSDQG
jgi:hypothetical protein